LDGYKAAMSYKHGNAGTKPSLSNLQGSSSSFRLAFNLNRLRIKAGLTVEELAELSRVDVEMIQKIEEGTPFQGSIWNNVEKLAKALKVKPAQELLV
jgi:DNA-binding XRE family transcriptional regulator